MSLTYDKEANAAYIYIKEISEGEIAKTISLNEDINIDLDKEGKTLGIEILNADKNIPNMALKSAKKISHY